MHGAPSGAAPTTAPAPGPLASLLIRSGARKGERVAIRVPVVNIGRAEYNDVVLAEESVSTQHAKLQRREGVWVLVDLGSTNGSFVDGERVEGEAPITPGATLRFGDASVIFDPKDEGAGVEKGGSTKMLQAIAVPAAAPKAATPAAPRTTEPMAKPKAAAAAPRAAQPPAPAAKAPAKPAAPAKAPASAPAAASGGMPKWLIPAIIGIVVVIAAFVFLLK